MKTFSKIAIISVILLVGSYVYAGWGGGYGPGRMGGGGGFNCPGYGQGGSQLSEAEVAKLNTLREKFYNETKVTRDKLYSKSRELRSAFDAKNPDKAKILSLQKDISDLRGKLSEKMVEFRLEAKKINPDFGFGYGRGGRGGWGRGGGCW